MEATNFNIHTAREITGGTRTGNIRTLDGMPVRIIEWNAKGRYPIVALVDMGDVEYPIKLTADGKGDFRNNVNTRYDLVIEYDNSHDAE